MLLFFQYKRIRLAIELSGGKTVLRDTPESETGIDLVSSEVCVVMVDAKEHKSLPTTCQQWITRVMETLRRSAFLFVCLTCLEFINPLRPSAKLQILLLCFHTFLSEVVGRSC